MRKFLYYVGKYDYDLPSPFTVRHEPFKIQSWDGTHLFGTDLEGEGDLNFLVVHGLFSHHRAPGLYQLAESMTRFGPVTTFDLRGHGRSGGLSTLGNLEALDAAAASEHARARSNLPLVMVGLSMGAAAAVRAAGLYETADAVVSISGPAEWDGPRNWAARRTRLVWRVPGGTGVMRVFTGVRIDRRWIASESPAGVAGKIAPSPLLVVHGTRDNFFPLEEGNTLFAAAEEPKELWVIREGGHAEGLFMSPGHPVDRDRVDRFVDEVVARVSQLGGFH